MCFSISFRMKFIILYQIVSWQLAARRFLFNGRNNNILFYQPCECFRMDFPYVQKRNLCTCFSTEIFHQLPINHRYEALNSQRTALGLLLQCIEWWTQMKLSHIRHGNRQGTKMCEFQFWKIVLNSHSGFCDCCLLSIIVKDCCYIPCALRLYDESKTNIFWKSK